MERRKFVVRLLEVEENGCSGFYQVVLEEDTHEICKSSVIDNIVDALDSFNDLQYSWFNEYHVDTRFDSWHLTIDVDV